VGLVVRLVQLADNVIGIGDGVDGERAARA